jgi:hypothetical protein
MGDVAGKEPFEQVAKRLLNEFLDERNDDETQEIVGQAYLEYILKRERIRRDATERGQRRDAVDYETLQTLKNADSDDPNHAHAMLTFQKFGFNPTKAMKYVDHLIKSRKTKLSRKMASIASNQRPRGRKPFAKVIDEIVKTDPSISRNSLLQILKKHEEINVIDNKIIYQEPHDEMPVSGLSQALSRSKKRLQKKI